MPRFWILAPGDQRRREVVGVIPNSPSRLVKEADYRDALAVRVGGITEVGLTVGRVDVMTERMVYEVKHVPQWKHGVMQVLAYSAESGLAASLAVFGEWASDSQRDARAVCKAVGISLWYYGQKGWQPSYRNSRAEDKAGLIAELQRTQRPLTPDEVHRDGNIVFLPLGGLAASTT